MQGSLRSRHTDDGWVVDIGDRDGDSVCIALRPAAAGVALILAVDLDGGCASEIRRWRKAQPVECAVDVGHRTGEDHGRVGGPIAGDEAQPRGAIQGQRPIGGSQRDLHHPACGIDIADTDLVPVAGGEDQRPVLAHRLRPWHRVHRRVIDATHGHGGVVVGAGPAVPVGEPIAHGAGPGRGRTGIRILIGDVLHQGRDRRGGRADVERDDEIAPAAAAGDRPDGHAAIGDVGAAHADLAGAGALIADREHVLRAVAAGREGDGERAAVEVGAVYIADERVAALLEHHGPGAFAVCETVTAQVRDGRRVIDGADGDGGVVVGAGPAVPVGEPIAHGAGPGRGRTGIRILIGDVLHQGRDRRGGRADVERDDEIAPAAAAGDRPDGHAAIGDVGAAHADLAGAGALIADREHVLRAVAAGREGDGERAAVEVRRIHIADRGVAALLDHHRASVFVVAQAVAAQVGYRRRGIRRRRVADLERHVLARERRPVRVDPIPA